MTWKPIDTATAYADCLVIGGEVIFPVAAWKDNSGLWNRLEE